MNVSMSRSSLMSSIEGRRPGSCVSPGRIGRQRGCFRRFPDAFRHDLRDRQRRQRYHERRSVVVNAELAVQFVDEVVADRQFHVVLDGTDMAVAAEIVEETMQVGDQEQQLPVEFAALCGDRPAEAGRPAARQEAIRSRDGTGRSGRRRW